MAEDYVWIPWDSILEHCEHVKPIRDVIPEFYVSLSPSSPQGGSWQLTEPTIDNTVYSLDTSFTPTQSGSGTPSPDNVRPIVGRTEVNVTVSPTQDAQDGHTTPVPLGQTVYGGVLDVTNGSLVVTYGIVDLGTLTWMYVAPDATHPNPRHYATLSDAPSGLSLNAICTNYVTNSSPVYTRSVDKAICLFDSKVHITDSAYTDATAFKAAMNGVMLAYELATPTTVQIPPTEIELFLGQNNIWSDTGENVHIATADDEQTGMIVTVYGKTLWMRSHIFYKDGTDEYTTPIRIG